MMIHVVRGSPLLFVALLSAYCVVARAEEPSSNEVPAGTYWVWSPPLGHAPSTIPPLSRYDPAVHVHAKAPTATAEADDFRLKSAFVREGDVVEVTVLLGAAQWELFDSVHVERREREILLTPLIRSNEEPGMGYLLVGLQGTGTERFPAPPPGRYKVRMAVAPGWDYSRDPPRWLTKRIATADLVVEAK